VKAIASLEPDLPYKYRSFGIGVQHNAHPKHGGRYRMDEFEADTTYDLLYTGR
jgi:hypothetical protein